MLCQLKEGPLWFDSFICMNKNQKKRERILYHITFVCVREGKIALAFLFFSVMLYYNWPDKSSKDTIVAVSSNLGLFYVPPCDLSPVSFPFPFLSSFFKSIFLSHAHFWVGVGREFCQWSKSQYLSFLSLFSLSYPSGFKNQTPRSSWRL